MSEINKQDLDNWIEREDPRLSEKDEEDAE